MKKVSVLLVLALTLALTSCSKEELGADCSCGLIVSDDVNDYSVTIRNACSGNEKRWVLYPGDWMTAYVGSDFCITNAGRW